MKISDLRITIPLNELTVIHNGKNSVIYEDPGDKNMVIKKFYIKRAMLKKIELSRMDIFVNHSINKDGYIRMDKCDGDLFDLIIHNRVDRISLEDIVETIVEHITYLYNNNFFYTDLKMENILYIKVDDKYKIFLGDIDSAIHNDITLTTFCHVIKLKKEYTINELKRIVIYALGITIFQLFLHGCYHKRHCDTFSQRIYSICSLTLKNIKYVNEDNYILYASNENKNKLTEQLFKLYNCKKYFVGDKFALKCFEIYYKCLKASINDKLLDETINNLLLAEAVDC